MTVRDIDRWLMDVSPPTVSSYASPFASVQLNYFRLHLIEIKFKRLET
jgi:hypothetical protein